ncbi:MAG: alpha-ribazole phosphatase family protein [Magnetococcales bacterium]|nr:alpha-ribazole phosphatase family protein [Magnetococcales bacterium]
MNKPAQDLLLTVDLLRHGEPEGGERYRGSLDDPLSASGWQQMERTLASLPVAERGWQRIITSPLRRCADFAGVLGQRLQPAAEVVVEPGLREMGFGAWEGRTTAEILAQDGQALRQFWRDPLHHTPPQGEPMEPFQQRIQGVWQSWLQDYPQQHLLVVTHGGVVRVLISLVLALPLEHLSRIVVPYANLTRLRVDRCDDQLMPRLVFHRVGY